MNTKSDATIVNVPCPDCGELSPEPIQRIAENDVIPCSICGGLIDLPADDCRPIVDVARRQWQAKADQRP